jgi:Transition state regulatory protein AbrB
MTEMTIISYALGIETAFVVTSQVFRSFFVLTCAPLLFRPLGIAPTPPAKPPVPGPRHGQGKSGGPDDRKSD